MAENLFFIIMDRSIHSIAFHFILADRVIFYYTENKYMLFSLKINI